MPPVPAHCPYCNRISILPHEMGALNIRDDGESRVIVHCEWCGRKFDILPGRYKFTDELKTVLPGIPYGSLAELHKIAKQAKAGRITEDAAVEQMSDVVPWLRTYFALGDGGQLRLWLLNTLISIILGIAINQATGISEEDVQDAVQKVLVAQQAAPQSPVPTAIQQPPTPGRNESCWCGSAKKYKHCHWPDPPPLTAKPLVKPE